jgi:hypothetical protein
VNRKVVKQQWDSGTNEMSLVPGRVESVEMALVPLENMRWRFKVVFEHGGLTGWYSWSQMHPLLVVE